MQLLKNNCTCTDELRINFKHLLACGAFFWQIYRDSVLSKNGFIIGPVRLVRLWSNFSAIVFFFCDSRAKARLIHLDSFWKADSLGFFRKVKISLLSKNGFKIGLECLISQRCQVIVLQMFFFFWLPRKARLIQLDSFLKIFL